MSRKRWGWTALSLVVPAVAAATWFWWPRGDWQQVDLPSGGTPVVSVDGVDPSDPRFPDGRAVAVLQVDPPNAAVRPGFVSGWHAEAFRHAHVMPSGQFRMEVRMGDVKFFVLPEQEGGQPVGLELVEVTTFGDLRYAHVPMY